MGLTKHFVVDAFGGVRDYDAWEIWIREAYQVFVGDAFARFDLLKMCYRGRGSAGHRTAC